MRRDEPAWSTCAALLAGLLALLAPWPGETGMVLRYDYLLVPGLLGLALWRGGHGDWPAAFWMACFCAATLRGLWASGLSVDYLMLGRLPYSDAAAYYEGAARLLAGETLSSFTTRRPLYTGFLTATLGLCQGSLPGALVLGGAFLAACLALVVRAWSRLGGRGQGALLGVLLFFYGRRFLGVTSTETLGVCLGACGMALLWASAGKGVAGAGIPGWTRRDAICWAGGLALLSLALFARAGAFFVLPAVWLWGAWRCRGGVSVMAREPGESGRSGESGWRWAGLGLAAMLVGFAVNTLLIRTLGAPDGGGFSNFSFTLYGLLTGGDWTTIFRERPELLAGSEAEAARRIYAACRDLFLDDPWRLGRGVLRAWRQAVAGENSLASFLIVSTPGPLSLVEHARWLLAEPGRALREAPWETIRFASLALWHGALALGNLLAPAWFWRERGTPLARLLLAIWAGILLSLPFAPPWDANNMRAYAATIVPICMLPILGWSVVLRCRGGGGEKDLGEERRDVSRAAWALGALLALLALSGPTLWRGSLPGGVAVEVRVGEGDVWALPPEPSLENGRRWFFQAGVKVEAWRKAREEGVAGWRYDRAMGKVQGP